jgi:ethanolamine utilization cobalamin adenosyltransferase
MEKPENCTHLRGKILVSKNHPVIKFRGQLDLLEANFITCINLAISSGYPEMADELNVIFLYLQEIMRSEVFDKPLSFIDFKGWSDDEVREYSHHPEKYFGVKHALPDPKYGMLYGEANKLRAMVRQLEIAAVEAFCGEKEDQCERPDIILALNRLSSLIYIIICKLIGGHYKV